MLSFLTNSCEFWLAFNFFFFFFFFGCFLNYRGFYLNGIGLEKKGFFLKFFFPSQVVIERLLVVFPFVCALSLNEWEFLLTEKNIIKDRCFSSKLFLFQGH